MPLTRITFRQLEAFASVADLHSFTASAERMGLTSSAISQLVAELENILGFRLFDRSTRRVTLTSAGRYFLTSGQSVLRHVQLAEAAASDVRNRAAGVVRVGAPLVLASTFLPIIIREFTLERPKVAVRLCDVAVDQIAEAVAAADVDLSVGPDRAHSDAVAREDVFDSPWVLWCSPEHRLARRKTLKWEDLRNETLVSAGRDHERSVAQMHLNAPEGERVRPVDVVDNVTTALGLASTGMAVTLAPAYVSVLAEKLGLVMRRVTSPETIRHVSVYRPTQRAIPPAAEVFGEFLVQRLKELHASKNAPAPKPRRITRAK